MFFDDPVTDTQTKTSAFADTLRCIERIEDSVGIFNSNAAVEELNPKLTVGIVHPHFKPAPTLTRLENRIDRVVDDVQEDLFELMRVGRDRRHLRRYIALDEDIVYPQIVIAQRQRLFHDLANVNFLLLGLPLPGKRQEVLYDAVCTLRLFKEFADEVRGAVIQAFAFEQLRITEDRRQRIVEFMGDARDQLPHGR